MNKKLLTIIIVCTTVLVMIAELTGCISDNNEKGTKKAAVCYILANTACSQGLNLQSPLIQDTIYDTVRNYGYIAVVNADGVPDVIMASSFDIDAKYKGATTEKLDSYARAQTTDLIANMQNVIANDPEVDYMAALNLAVRTMSSLDDYDSKTIIVVGTGLSTTGILNFQNNLLSADTDTIVELLKGKQEIPNFSGITIYWQQMGDVSAPQQNLTSAQRKKLQQIYGEIVEAGGGAFFYNEIIANPINANATYPTVTPIELPADSPIIFDSETLDSKEVENVFTKPVVLTEEQVTFIGDKAEYLNHEDAESIIKPISEFLVKNKINILLCGTTAGDTNSTFTMELSQARAETVKQTLVDLGVNASQIIAVGLGSTDPWHVYGIPTSDSASSCNRKVVLLDASSTTAQEIIAKSASKEME